jgi:outer membrane lipoprotein SlyB
MEAVMAKTYARCTIAVAMAAILAGCVAPPPRPTTRYYQDRAAYDDRYYDNQGGYYDRGDRGDRGDRACHDCGRVTDVERVYARDHSTSGGGAVIGAIVGGLLGSTVGKGDGRTAATVAGAVAGGFAGVDHGSAARDDRRAQFLPHQLTTRA